MVFVMAEVFIHFQFYNLYFICTLQLQSLIRECISAEPSSRPDIHYVYGVAQEMHSRRMLRHPVTLHPPSTVSIRGVPLQSTSSYKSSSVELSVHETRELPSASFLSQFFQIYNIFLIYSHIQSVLKAPSPPNHLNFCV